jgi:hypothetical protein
MIKTNAVRVLDRLAINTSYANATWIPAICLRKQWQQRSAYQRSRFSRLSSCTEIGVESAWG